MHTPAQLELGSGDRTANDCPPAARQMPAGSPVVRPMTRDGSLTAAGHLMTARHAGPRLTVNNNVGNFGWARESPRLTARRLQQLATPGGRPDRAEVKR